MGERLNSLPENERHQENERRQQEVREVEAEFEQELEDKLYRLAKSQVGGGEFVITVAKHESGDLRYGGAYDRVRTTAKEQGATDAKAEEAARMARLEDQAEGRGATAKEAFRNAIDALDEKLASQRRGEESEV